MLGEYDAGYENCIDSLIREIEKLQDENDKLSEQVSSLVGRSFRTADKMSCIEAENAKLQNDAELLRAMLSQVQTEKRCYMADNAELREQLERLVTLLRNDCDIDASWDGLRKFWSIGLTEDGCLMRDRACKAEADNAKLRELVRWMYDRMDESCAVQHPYAPAPISYDRLMQALARAHKLGVEVDG